MNNYIVTLDEQKHNITIAGENEVKLNDKPIEYELINLSHKNYLLRINNKFYDVYLENIDKEKITFLVNGTSYDVLIRTFLQEKASQLIQVQKLHDHLTEIKAPMPGMIIKINKQAGDKVEHGESVMILEAMKMENEVRAPKEGIIEKIVVNQNSPVDKGGLLFTIKNH
ncbi:MAG: acetyl-CoA carboxylase biotin carboxyl carrier protein subunit [Syntrophothermus sp.]